MCSIQRNGIDEAVARFYIMRNQSNQLEIASAMSRRFDFNWCDSSPAIQHISMYTIHMHRSFGKLHIRSSHFINLQNKKLNKWIESTICVPTYKRKRYWCPPARDLEKETSEARKRARGKNSQQNQMTQKILMEICKRYKRSAML